MNRQEGKIELIQTRSAGGNNTIMLGSADFQDCIQGEYRTLEKCPEVIAGCFTIAELIASMTIHLKANTERGDERIVNELSRKIDIEPSKYMVRSTWMTAIVMNLLLYGRGNSIVWPHTKQGLLDDLTPIAASRVSFDYIGYDKYKILIDGKPHDPTEMLHFVLNPDPTYLWKGQGFKVSLNGVNKTLAQAEATKKAFMSSKWKPPLIVKVDALTDEFSSPQGRRKLLESYVESQDAGEPWVIPADQFSVESVRPLTLNDLAIHKSVELDKQTVASILGVPPFVLGVGNFEAQAWNAFVNNRLRPIAQAIEQEMTRKLILSPKMFLQFNMQKLYSYDVKAIYEIYSGLYDKGLAKGNEVRDQLGMEPLDGLDELVILENYIPVEKIGDQSKLQGGNNNG